MLFCLSACWYHHYWYCCVVVVYSLSCLVTAGIAVFVVGMIFVDIVLIIASVVGVAVAVGCWLLLLVLLLLLLLAAGSCCWCCCCCCCWLLAGVVVGVAVAVGCWLLFFFEAGPFGITLRKESPGKTGSFEYNM